MKHLGLFGCLATLLLASACSKDETVESEDIRTSGIYPEFTVLAEGNGKATATVTLKVGGNDSNTTLELTGKDKLVCSIDADSEKTLSKSGESYKATFNTDAAGTVFTFAFNRGDEDENAPDSHVTLPDPFTPKGVTSSTEVSRASGSATITWDESAADDTSTWTLTGECLNETSGKVTTDGTLTLKGDNFDPDAFASKDDATDEEKNCEATVCIERKLTGSLDSAFKNEEGGEIRAIQRRCTSFKSTP